MLQRIFAIFRARNLEFLRDRASLSWSIILPVALMFGLAFIFSGSSRNEYTVGVVQESSELAVDQHPFLTTRYVKFVAINDRDAGFRKVARHQLDLLLQLEGEKQYWVNPDSRKGYFQYLDCMCRRCDRA